MREISAGFRHFWLVRKHLGPLLVVGAVYVCAGLRLLSLTNRYAVNILFRDSWRDYDAILFEPHSLLEIFRWQAGPHRIGLWAVILRILEPLIRWNSRYESFGIVAVLLITPILALWLKRRLYGEIKYRDLIVPLLLLTPVQYQVIYEGGSGTVFMALLAIAYALAWTISRESVRWLLVLIFNFLLIYADYGFFFGIITPLLLSYQYWRSRNRAVLIVLVLAVLSLASFFIGYKFNSGTACFSPGPENPFYYVLFIAFMLSSFVGVQPVLHLALALALGLGLLVVFAWAAVTVTTRLLKYGSTGDLIAFALLGYSVLFYVGAAYGRMCLGLSAAQASRYTGYSVVGFFALCLLANSLHSRKFLSAVLVCAVMSTFGLSRWDKAQMTAVSEGRRKWRDCYVVHHDIALCDQESRSTIYWTPEPPDLQRKLQFLETHHLNLFSERAKR